MEVEWKLWFLFKYKLAFLLMWQTDKTWSEHDDPDHLQKKLSYRTGPDHTRLSYSCWYDDDADEDNDDDVQDRPAD